MHQLFEINLVGFLAGALPVSVLDGVSSPYMHWSATLVMTPSDFMKASTSGLFQLSADSGCSIKK